VEQRFDWRRLWCPLAREIRLDFGGFLADPTEWLGVFNAHLKTLEQLADIPCLVLLGEPGIGKSTALRSERERLSSQASRQELVVLSADLRECSGEGWLHREVFSSPKWRQWVTGEHTLFVLLDSLDEALVEQPRLGRYLISGLRGAPLERLRLRIACRTADWHHSLTPSLAEVWPTPVVGPSAPESAAEGSHGVQEAAPTPVPAVETYELAPLLRSDVELAAGELGLAPQEFLAAVKERDIGPLASKPLTLMWLLREYAAQGQLPASQVELYEKGCLSLCEERSPSRRDAGIQDARYVGMLDRRQRLAIASRVAAVMVVGGRVAVSRDPDLAVIPETDVAVGELAGGAEEVNGAEVAIDGRAIGEVLRTGLFTSRGTNRFGWAHQTFAEFLAARYLKDAPLVQVQSLLCQADDWQKRPLPYLRQTTAWLAAIRDDVQDWVLSVEADLLLHSDIGHLPPDLKKRLVDGVFDRLIQRGLSDRAFGAREYRRLAHPGLAAQLEPVIKDRTLDLVPRRVAIDVAEACGLRELQSLLADIALDVDESVYIRQQAAAAVREIGDPETKRRMEPLAKGQAGQDPDDYLRVYGMQCMWPEHWSIDDLLDHVAPPAEAHHIGLYRMFLSHRLAESLSAPDICIALGRACEWLDRGRMGDHLRELCDGLVVRAWELLREPGVDTALARLLVACIREYAPWVRSPGLRHMELDSAPRRLLVARVLNDCMIAEDECSLLVHCSHPPVLRGDEDLEWLLESIASAEPEAHPLWAECIVHLLPASPPTKITGLLLEARKRVAALAEKVPIQTDLDSPAARASRADYYKAMEVKARCLRDVPDARPRAAYVEDALAQMDGGEVNAWHTLATQLWREHPGDTSWTPSTELTEAPGWAEIGSELQSQVRAVARRFVLEGDPPGEQWVDTGGYTGAWLSACSALLLTLEDRKLATALPSAFWDRWAPVLLFGVDEGISDAGPRALTLAYANARDRLHDLIGRILDREIQGNRCATILHNLDAIWDDDLANIALEKLNSITCSPESFKGIASLLIGRDIAAAREAICGRFRTPVPPDDRAKQIAEVALALAIAYSPDDCWDTVTDAVSHEPLCFAGAVRRLASEPPRDEQATIGPQDEQHIADLFRWIKTLGVTDESAEQGSARSRSLDRVGRLAGSLIDALVQRGTVAACQALSDLIAQLPGQREWLRACLNDAEDNLRRDSWRAPSPRDIIRLLASSESRYVDSPDQLLGVVMESLVRMENHLQGNLPAAEAMWNYQGSGNRRHSFRPKDEEALSDAVTRWLRHDLQRSRVVVNREVQPRRGQQTDVWVEAAPRNRGHGDGASVNVVIEVKGQWHREVHSAMQEQLVERYLLQNRLTHGIYLVGWYLCDEWDHADQRKAQARRNAGAMDELLTQLEQQTAELESEHTARGLCLAARIIDVTWPSS